MAKIIPGINIQWPWSQYIASGEKTVETRTYPIPEKHLGSELAIIETPGPNGKKNGILKSRIIGTVIFERCKKYENSESWKLDKKNHLVSTDDPSFNWDPSKEKWGWEVQCVRKFEIPVEAPSKKGIVFAKECVIPYN